jgi:AraC-like DNA-binding protein
MNRKLFLLALLTTFIPLAMSAQLFRHLSVNDGMVSRHVISLCKDRTGYLWMLNHEGVERFDGSHFTHYELLADEGAISPTRGLATLATDSTQTLWVICHTGDVFRYDEARDTFVPALDFALLRPQDGRGQPITATRMDVRRNAIWLCTRSAQYLFSLADGRLHSLQTGIHEPVLAVEPTEDGKCFLATEKEVIAVSISSPLSGHSPSAANSNSSGDTNSSARIPVPHVRSMYYHAASHQLILATADRGIYLYNIGTRAMGPALTELKDVEVSAFVPVPGDDQALYVATQGAGLYRLDLGFMETNGERKASLIPFLQANPNTPHSLQSDILNDLYIDDAQRLWMATYPMGVSVYSEQYPAHQWICHSYDNANSLSSGQIHDILEDRDGDLWFATNDGVSCCQHGRWTTLLTQASSTHARRNYTFTALCDLDDGRLLAGGYMSDLYLIHKATMKAEEWACPAKYIRSILLSHDAQGRPDGLVWIGGQQGLMCLDLHTRRLVKRVSPGFPVATLTEQDADYLWVGTLNGLFRLHKASGSLSRLEPRTEMGRITSICPTPQGPTYIATLGDGLWVYEGASNGKGTSRFIHYTAQNSTLITDDIFCVLPARDGRLILSTERGITTFNPAEGRFYHWGHDQGLMFTSFNPGAGLHTRDGRYLFGTEEGALAFSDTVTLHRPFHSQLVLGDVILRRGSQSSAQALDLPHDEGSFALEASSLNFDNPSSILYSWRLEGARDEWTAPSREAHIRYTHLTPGHYRLHVRSLLEDDLRTVDERTLEVTIRPPWWLSWPALVLYLLVSVGVCIALCRLFWLRRVKRQAEKHAVVTLLAAQEMMEPLEQIKEPLSRLQHDASLSREGQAMVSEALRHTESLDELFIRRVSEVVQHNLQGNALSVDKLCNELGISRTTLYTRLKEITGEAPADYIRRLRLDESARLLLTREYTVAEVADMMGFSDPKYFTEVFKRYFGVPPTQYVKQHLQGKSKEVCE